ncbi:MAG: aldehyde ferredoxin oxidoreductase family protein [Spirochaetes bacterium]|nr:aldehyde ferredoxin oxidoreductase family protein [Spirochaetota bacterium]
MLGGYMGKLLFVDLSTGKIHEETPDESLYRDYLGGYGIGARILYDRQKPGVDPLSPDSIFSIVTGPLTGTPSMFGCRFAVVSKSPLTGGYGDANSGGDFGPYLKFAGYDAAFISGKSDKPVYLLIDNGKAEIKDASHLWGKYTEEVEETLESEYGRTSRVMCIGPSGEKLSLISCIITNRGDALGRSGLGAVLGSKNLKAVVAKGEMEVPLADPEGVKRIKKKQLEAWAGYIKGFGADGTGGHANESAHSGDTPVRNWGGVGVVDMPDASGLDVHAVKANQDKRKGCWRCPIACKASLKEGQGDYKYPAGTHRCEYETLAAFGANCLNSNVEAINMANHLCNYYGMDTISAGSTIAFAMECYEHGIITKEDTDGIELTWGNHKAIVEMTEKMVKREGFGDILADGVKAAAEKIGKGSEKYAVHIGGQELGMHDPKGGFRAYIGKPAMAMYQMDAAPGRHVTGFGPTQFKGYIINAAGLCMHGDIVDIETYLADMIKTVTGIDRTYDELMEVGERIGTMRHLFTIREGDNPLKRFVHPRIPGLPPLKEGPLAGVSIDAKQQAFWNLGYMDWDPNTTRPSRKKLLALGMPDVADELWPVKEQQQ